MMKKLVLFLVVAISVYACQQKRERPTEALDTAREFIRSSLDGDYDWAKELMLNDSSNAYILQRLEKNYNTGINDAEKAKFKDASIIVHSVDPVSDSVVIVNYSNSYKKKQLPLKVIKKDGKWQVDLNYTFTGNL